MLARLAVRLAFAAALLLAGSAHAEEPASKAVVFVPPRDIESPLRDALTAQLSDVAAELVVEHFVSEPDTFKQHVEESRSLAAAHQAIGVFWLDTRADEWLVFLGLPGERRVLMRRIPIGPDGSAAAMEAVAVITRESTTALLAGKTIGMTEVVVPDEPEPIPAPKPVPPAKPPPAAGPKSFGPFRGMSLAFSFNADAYAKGSGVTPGFGFAASWNFSNRFRAGATYALFPSEEKDVDGLFFLVRRYPIGVEAAYSFGSGKWLLGPVARTMVELTSRHTVRPTSSVGDSHRPVVFLSPRLRLDYRVSEVMNLFVAVGADFALNGFSFVNRVDGVDHTIFEPRLVRPAGEVGVAFWP